MAAAFLSPGWIEELDAAARASSSFTAFDVELVVEQRVSGTPDGEVRYHVVLGGDRARVQAGSAAAPDVVITTDYETARAIHEGRQNAQRAAGAGRLEVHGDLQKVLQHAAAFAALDDVFAELRAST
jgi:putative sterol carrier protein